jgi:tripartite-type tricarboxylate transporter receptor subunit TctC
MMKEECGMMNEEQQRPVVRRSRSSFIVHRSSLILLGASILLPGSSIAAAADVNYPVRPIRIIVPQSPGASTDLTARLIAQKLGETFRQTVIVDNRPGSSGIAGSEIVARAAPDGYTLMVVASSFSINPALGRKLPYDSIRDFTTVSQLSKFPNMMAAHPSAPVKTLQDVNVLAKAKPGSAHLCVGGRGNRHAHVGRVAQVHDRHRSAARSIQGGGPAATATMGGQTQLVVATTVGLLPHVRTGQAQGGRAYQRETVGRRARHSDFCRGRCRAMSTSRGTASSHRGGVAEARAREINAEVPASCRRPT